GRGTLSRRCGRLRTRVRRRTDPRSATGRLGGRTRKHRPELDRDLPGAGWRLANSPGTAAADGRCDRTAGSWPGRCSRATSADGHGDPGRQSSAAQSVTLPRVEPAESPAPPAPRSAWSPFIPFATSYRVVTPC